MRSSLLLLLSSVAVSAPAIPVWASPVARSNAGSVHGNVQQAHQFFLWSPRPQQQSSSAFEADRVPPPETVPEPRKPYYQFDARENSVGVVFTVSGQGAVHLWLPLNRKVYTRDAPTLPLHPQTARITTMIHTSPELAAPERFDRVQCDVWTYSNRTRGRGNGLPEKWKISFAKRDGLARFADKRARFWLGGKEVESYECS